MTINQTPNKPFIVYGTLRPGHGNYAWALSGRTTSEQDIIVRGARLTSQGGFPYMVFADNEDAVATLVYVDEKHYAETMSDLDHLEGYVENSPKNLYDRITVTVQDAAGNDVDAWLYVPAGGTLDYALRLKPVPGNDWNKWVEPCRLPTRRTYWPTV